MSVTANKKTEAPWHEKPLTLWPISAFANISSAPSRNGTLPPEEDVEDNAKEAELPVV